jgi:uncharacterized protein (TIGR00369 family)
MSTAEELAPWREAVRGGYPDPDLFKLAGIDMLRGMIRGEVADPPIRHLIGMELTDVGPGNATFSMPASPWLLSPQGLVSVGTLAILADGPLGCAVQTTLPPATGYATSELSMRLLRPARTGGKLIARGSLVHGNRVLALSNVQIFDDRGRLLADGSSLCFVLPPRDPSAAAPDAPQPRAAAAEANSPDPFERPALGEVLSQDIWDRLSGREVLELQVAGELPGPPMHYLTGVGPMEVGDGEAVFTLPCHEWLCSPLGTVEGGVIAMLADSALVSAVQTTAPAGAALGAIDLKVNFLRPVFPDGRDLVARGRVRHSGRTITVSEAEVVNADGKTVALATGSVLVLPGRPASLSGVEAEA